MDSDLEYSDVEVDEKTHDNLIANILSLNKAQNVKKASRTEPTLQISEFNLVKSATGKVGDIHLDALTSGLKKSSRLRKINLKLQSTSKRATTLPKPLEKPKADRIRRNVAYENARLQLDKWEATVASNRAASYLSFPLNDDPKLKMEVKKAEEYSSNWRIKGPLEKELEKIEKVQKYHVDTDKLEKEKFKLTAKEIKDQRKEAAKLRAHQSYREAKARRQNKIKSKKYHRIQRREKIKKALKEFEELQKKDPEEALKKLEDIEKARAMERFSLRHKSTGQWAKSKQIRAKYDKNSRQVLAQQLAISRDLTQKLKTDKDSDDEDEGIESGESSETGKIDEDNPWTASGNIKAGKEVVDFVSGYRKYWDSVNKTSENKIEEEITQNDDSVDDTKSNSVKILENITVQEKHDKMETKSPTMPKKIKSPSKTKKKSLNSSTCSTDDWDVEIVNSKGKKLKKDSSISNLDVEEMFDDFEEKISKNLKEKIKKMKEKPKMKPTKKKKKSKSEKNQVDYLSMPSQSKRPKLDEELMESTSDNPEKSANAPQVINSDSNKLKSILDETKKAQNIDPNKYLKPKKVQMLNSATPDLIVDDNDDDDLEEQRKLIVEAFKDDDIADDFRKEKNEDIEKNKPKNIDLSLPGWGSWGGTNIKPSKRKKKRFIVKMPKQMPRKDSNKGNLIINENAQNKIKPHLVAEVPFPFKTVKDFEASIRAPIGNTFLPETAFKRLIKPAVTTKIGSIIEPISDDILVNKKK